MIPWTRELISGGGLGAGGAAARADGKVIIPWALIERLRASASLFASCWPSRIRELILSRSRDSMAMRFRWVARMFSNSCQKFKLISAELRVISRRSSWTIVKSRGTSSFVIICDIVKGLVGRFEAEIWNSLGVVCCLKVIFWAG